MRRTISALMLLAVASPVHAQSWSDVQRDSNLSMQRQLFQGHQQMLQMTQPRYYGAPAFPLFRCDGQRPPMIGAENCPNWRLHEQQMRVLRLQEQELRAKLNMPPLPPASQAIPQPPKRQRASRTKSWRRDIFSTARPQIRPYYSQSHSELP